MHDARIVDAVDQVDSVDEVDGDGAAKAAKAGACRWFISWCGRADSHFDQY